MKKSGKLVGAGIALAAAAAAGTYFLTGKRGKKNREKIAAWTLKIKGEVLKKMKEIKELDMEAYYDLVDKVAERYEKMERIGAAELKHLKKELKSAWTHISKELK